MAGSAIVRQLKKIGYQNILTAPHDELDLIDQLSVNKFFQKNKIDQVYLAAAKVGGIAANSKYPAEFIYKNLMIEANVIHAAHEARVQKLLFLGSSCIYPRLTSQPINEDSLLTGTLEPTNEAYAIAKIAGIKLCESYNRQYGTDYRSVMPTNLYGPFDNYHSENSHVIPALLKRFHLANIEKNSDVVIWGTGNPKREFLYVDDMADAAIYIMNLPEDVYRKITTQTSSFVNIGSGEEVSIRELAETISRITGFNGQLVFDKTKPDGSPRKLLNISRLKSLGWQAKTPLDVGLRLSYEWFTKNQN